MTVVQSAGNGSLFDICWIGRLEEKASIIQSYFAPFTHTDSCRLRAFGSVSDPAALVNPSLSGAAPHRQRPDIDLVFVAL